MSWIAGFLAFLCSAANSAYHSDPPPLSNVARLEQQIAAKFVPQPMITSTNAADGRPPSLRSLHDFQTALTGVWIDPSGSNSFEFRPDGTYAERLAGRLVNYTIKCNQDTGLCGKPQYPSSATSTGLWSLDSPAHALQERVEIYPGQASVPISSQITERLATTTIIIELHVDQENPEYLGAWLSGDKNTMELFYLLGGDIYGKYVKQPSP